MSYDHDNLMADANASLPWSSASWFASATAWAQEQMTIRGFMLAGPIEQVQASLWSAVLRIPTETETLYFKASAPVFAYEPALTERLSQLAPEHIPPVLVIDRERHWMLMRDAGTPVSKLADLRLDPTQWEEILRRYAQMQLHLMGQQEALLAAGCPDRRLERLPTLLEEALDDTALLLLNKEPGLPEDEYAQLRLYIAQVRAQCAELKSYGISETLHHDDLHGGNILSNGKSFVFFDWAECAVTHPFCSLVVVERIFRYVLEFPVETIVHLRDSYLRQWTQFASLEQLQVAYAIAQRLGKLCRALTWRSLLASLKPSERQQDEDAYPYWLRVFLGTEE